jgi:hypothetical protein
MPERYRSMGIDDSAFNTYLEEKTYPSKFEKVSVLKPILEYVKNMLACDVVVLEGDYIDADYASQFSLLYSKSFKRFSNICDRIHFFKGGVDLKEMKEGLSSDVIDSYLGYTVLTPLMCGKVGRTVVPTWSIDEYMESRDYYPVFSKADFRAHIYDKEFTISGFPFITQDSMVMVCAQASIWMAAFFMHGRYGRYGIPRHFPQDITEAASRYLPWGGRVLPSEGLLVEHMVNAFSNLGYGPILNLKPPTQDWIDPLELIQKYVDSDLPVVVILRPLGHAVTVVGYITCRDRRADFNPPTNIISSDGWISALIVNDDQLGPYRIMPTSQNAFNIFRESPKKDLLPRQGWWKMTNEINGLVVPLQREVCIQASHIVVLLKELFRVDPENRILQILASFQTATVSPLIEMFLATLLGQTQYKVVARSFLIRAVEYLNKMENRLNPKILSYYRDTEWPLFIWVVELSISREYDTKRPNEREVIGEIIFDSTANKYAPSHLCIHLPGILIKRNPHTEDHSIAPIEDDTPYICLI